jgi:PAS domain S-box-containing protein
MSTDTHAWVCQQIVDQAQDAIIFADLDGVIRLWNAGAEAIFGYRTDEAVGRTLDLIIPTQLRARHWSGYRQVMATGLTRYGREVLAVPALRKDGTRISLEFTIILLRDAAGDLLGPAAILREVTGRWQRDKALKERLAALEAHVRGTHGLAEDERRDDETQDRRIPPG